MSAKTSIIEVEITADVIEMTDLDGNTVAAFQIPDAPEDEQEMLSGTMWFFNRMRDPDRYCLVAPNGCRFSGPFDDSGKVADFEAFVSWYVCNK
jgi:hypothetical protein